MSWSNKVSIKVCFVKFGLFTKTGLLLNLLPYQNSAENYEISSMPFMQKSFWIEIYD